MISLFPCTAPCTFRRSTSPRFYGAHENLLALLLTECRTGSRGATGRYVRYWIDLRLCIQSHSALQPSDGSTCRCKPYVSHTQLRVSTSCCIYESGSLTTASNRSVQVLHSSRDLESASSFGIYTHPACSSSTSSGGSASSPPSLLTQHRPNATTAARTRRLRPTPNANALNLKVSS